MRRPSGLLAAVCLVLLTACTSGGSDGAEAEPSPSAPSTSAAAPSSAAPSPVPVPTTPVEGCDGGRVVEVSTARDLQAALDAARPGEVIRLADGRYEGNFVASAQAGAEAPIRLCGGRGAVLDGGDVDGDYTLHLSGATHWQVSGLTVTGGQKGVMVDAGSGIRLEGLLVTSMGDEAIHLRTNSSDNAVVRNTIRDTGLRKPKFGEGVYVGSAEGNWCQLTDCAPDRSDRNLIEGNDIAGTTAEAVDIKEGTSDGVLRGNTFDGAAMVEADSWVDVKGNGWRIEGNTGTSTSADGFQVHEVVDGWGRDTVFSGNVVSGVPELAINVAGPRAIRTTTTVSCDNEAGDASGGLSNVSCGGR
ncbi:right-handed parallel beta-helix repeat-containing protein [Geodermatophilus sp. SYSU D00779]